MIDFKQLACLNRDELLENVVPFWLTHSQDERYARLLHLPRPRGRRLRHRQIRLAAGTAGVAVFDALQPGREASRSGSNAPYRAEFLRKHGHDGNYNWYFSLTREGRPLVAPYNIFSYTFATMAFAQAALATGSDQYAEIAKRHLRADSRKTRQPQGTVVQDRPGHARPEGFRPADDPLQHGARSGADHRPRAARRDDPGIVSTRSWRSSTAGSWG